MTAPQLTESLSDRLTALKRPLPDGLIARARTGAEALSSPVVRTVASKDDLIDATNPPARPSALAPAADRPHHRALNRLAGTVGIAVVAAAVATFGLELSGHIHSTAPAPATRLAAMPVTGSSGFPASAQIVVPTTRGTGRAVLPTFLAQATVLYVQYDCIGSGQLEIQSTNQSVKADLQPCSRSVAATTVALDAQATGAPLTLDVVTGSSVKWELLVAESQVPANFPSLSIGFPVGAFPLLVGDTYADGSAALPSFTPTKKPYWIQYACMGTGSITILSSDGSLDYTSESCNASPGINGLVVPKNQVTGQPVSLRIATTQSTTWEARVVQFSGAAPKPYEIVPPTPAPGYPYPIDFTLHPGETPLIPDTHGTGSATLPTFTPTTKYWNSAFSCSGPGALEIIGSDGSTATWESCGTPTIGYGDDGEAKSGVPISLMIKTDPGTTWEIMVFGVNFQIPLLGP
jgi:hypothetical protein